MLEKSIAELTVTINNLIDVIQGGATPANTEPVEAEKAPADTREKTTDVEDVRAALIDLAEAKGKAAAKTLLADFNASKVGDLQTADYVKIVDVATQYREAA